MWRHTLGTRVPRIARPEKRSGEWRWRKKNVDSVNRRRHSPTGTVTVLEKGVVDTNVLKDLDDGKRGAREDRLDSASRGLLRLLGLRVNRLRQVRRRDRTKGDRRDESDAERRQLYV